MKHYALLLISVGHAHLGEQRGKVELLISPVTSLSAGHSGVPLGDVFGNSMLEKLR